VLLHSAGGGAYPHPTATWVIPSRQAAKSAKAVLSKSRTTRIPFLTKTRKLLAVMIFLSPSRKGRKGCAQQITDNVYSFLDKNKKTPCSDDFSLAKPQRTQRLCAANHEEPVFHSNKNNKNPCRDARASPSVSFWYRRASKQASASRHQEETAFVPQACITARKTIKTADAAGIATPAWNILAAHSHIMLNNHATH